ncbi:hypothetical protein ACEPAH_4283 [Sanghuangporus vaninii]
MRSDILALSAMAFAGFFATAVQAEDWWYAIYYADKDGGFNFLDSDNTNVVTNKQPTLDYVDSGKDKGLRWKFLSGKMNDGYFATQAHEDHIVGYDSGDNEFHADFKKSNDDSAVMAHFINDQQLTLCFDNNCIGSGAKKTEDKFAWNFTQIQGA